MYLRRCLSFTGKHKSICADVHFLRQLSSLLSGKFAQMSFALILSVFIVDNHTKTFILSVVEEYIKDLSYQFTWSMNRQNRYLIGLSSPWTHKNFYLICVPGWWTHNHAFSASVPGLCSFAFFLYVVRPPFCIVILNLSWDLGYWFNRNFLWFDFRYNGWPGLLLINKFGTATMDFSLCWKWYFCKP